MSDIQSIFEKKLDSHTNDLRVQLYSDKFYGITSGTVVTDLGTYTYSTSAELNDLYDSATTLYESVIQDGVMSWSARLALALKTMDMLKKSGRYELDSEQTTSKSVTYRPLSAMESYISFCQHQATLEKAYTNTSSIGIGFYGNTYNPGDRA